MRNQHIRCLDLEAIPFDVLTFPGVACCGYREQPEHDRPAPHTGRGFVLPAVASLVPLRAGRGAEHATWCEVEPRPNMVRPSGLFSGGGSMVDSEETESPQLATEGEPLRLRRIASATVDAASIDAAAFLAMSAETYATCYVLCVASARRGRIVGSTSTKASVPLPPPTSVEDDETATDAIGMAWALVAKAGHAAPVMLARAIARRLGVRRAQHRLRERSGLLTEPATDHRVPAPDARMTVAELIEAAPARRRDALRHALARSPLTGAQRQARLREKRRAASPQV